jgi:penicillin-binding protein 1A
MAGSEKQRLKKYLRIFWILVLLPLCLLLLFVLGAASGLFGKLPTFEELENPQTYLASEVYSSDGQVLGKYYVQNRSNIQYRDISPYVIKGLVATEDARFYEHSGVDIRSLFRVFFKTFLGHRSSSGGGSTITQQLAKMLFPRETNISKFKLAFRKFKEWIIAARLERQYTKEEIITMYLNRFDFINNAVGIQSASRVYFSTTPDSLKIEQAAVLVGMEKNPALFNPVRRKERSIERRNTVLEQMLKYNYITQHKFDSLEKVPLVLHFRPENPDEGLASYFREYLRDNFMRKWCEQHPKPDGTKYDIYKDGLKIYTTIDSRMQKYAEEAMEENCKNLQPHFFAEIKNRKNAPFDFRINRAQTEDLLRESMHRSDRYMVLKLDGASDAEIEKNFNTPVPMTVFTWRNSKHSLDTTMSPMDSIKYAKSFLQSGFASIDPHTGYIKAWVGGIDHKFFKYDHVTVAKRQVGSTFKPFIYTLAVQHGYSPCYEMPNVPFTYNYDGQSWTPKNADLEDEGKVMTLKEALAKSVDRIAARLTYDFSPQAVVAIVRHMGLKDPIDAVPSLCLGTCEMSVKDMVGAYCTYANKGIWVEPTFVTRIEDKNGRVLDQVQPSTDEAMSQQDAYVMLNMMQGVVDYGTGVRLRYKYKFPPTFAIAGKTGTTQNNSDGWFIGITPDLVSGCWSGFEDRAIHFESMEYGQGASESLPVWAFYMEKVCADRSINISQGQFIKPDKPLTIETDCNRYKQQEDINNSVNPF